MVIQGATPEVQLTLLIREYKMFGSESYNLTTTSRDLEQQCLYVFLYIKSTEANLTCWNEELIKKEIW